jgi:hypothetical protein
LIGRDLRPEEDKPGGAKVVLLNYDLWQRMFEGDRNVLGRVVKLDEQPYTVIGVLPHAVWSKTSCCLPVVVLQEAAQSLLGAHVAIAATHPLLSRWKKQNIFLYLDVFYKDSAAIDEVDEVYGRWRQRLDPRRRPYGD